MAVTYVIDVDFGIVIETAAGELRLSVRAFEDIESARQWLPL